MTTRQVLEAIAPILQPVLYQRFHRRDLCILSTRVALDVCEHFGVEAREQPVKCMVYNRQFDARVQSGPGAFDEDNWMADGSYSVGVGFGFNPRTDPEYKWNGHLIVIGPDCFGDFSIQQAERPEHDILIGTAVVSDYTGVNHWRVANADDTTIEYWLTANNYYTGSPDWRDETRRRRLVGTLIRQVRAMYPALKEA